MLSDVIVDYDVISETLQVTSQLFTCVCCMCGKQIRCGGDIVGFILTKLGLDACERIVLFYGSWFVSIS